MDPEKKQEVESEMKKYLLYVSHLYSFSIVRPLLNEIRKRGDDVKFFLTRPEYAHLLKPGEEILETARDVIRYNPRAVFVASNGVPDFFPGIKVQLFHGFNAQKRDENKGHFRLRGFFDLYCTQGSSTTDHFLELEQKYQYFKVFETGWPKMDPLFGKTEIKPSVKPNILFTSTFTPKLSAAHILFDTIRELSEKSEWDFTVTFHSKMNQKVVNRYKNLQSIRFIETDNTIPLLQEADVMLSDTSSILSEFLLLQKPVVTFRNKMPGHHLINVTESDKIGPALRKALTKPKNLMTKIKTYTDTIHPYHDGRSSGRVLDAAEKFICDYKGKIKRKPLNFFRRAKMHWKHKVFF